jgi:hypothetical protein
MDFFSPFEEREREKKKKKKKKTTKTKIKNPQALESNLVPSCQSGLIVRIPSQNQGLEIGSKILSCIAFVCVLGI